MIVFLASLFAALFGLALGSFLNVCLCRWPAGESVVKPRSHCRGCHRTLTWWENVPLLSWLVLGGRCRTCRSWIGWRYPLVEAAVGAGWAIAFAQFLAWQLGDAEQGGLALHAVQCGGTLLLMLLLTALAALDAEYLWLPDRVTIPGAMLGVLLEGVRAWLVTGMPQHAAAPAPLLALSIRVLEALGVAVLVLIFRALYSLIRHREGLGLGDVKLMALLTAWLGLPGAAVSFVVGLCVGMIVALAAMAQARRESSGEGEPWGQIKLPFGTFLCIGGFVAALWGQPLIDAYWKWAGL